MESEALRTAQIAEQQAWRRWKRQPNPTTYEAYKRASSDTGRAILDLYNAQKQAA
jgi:hypothetical protein